MKLNYFKLIFLSLFLQTIKTNLFFTKLNDTEVNENFNNLYLFQSFKTINEIKCLSICQINRLCFVMLIKNSFCFLFNKTANEQDMINNKKSLTYIKTFKVKSCKELFLKYPKLNNGIYVIDHIIGYINIYCHKFIDGGGWTFIPNYLLNNSKFNDSFYDDIFKNQSSVLMISQSLFNLTDQKYSIIKYLPIPNNTMSISTCNFYPFINQKSICLKTVTEKLSVKNTQQGFISNDIDIKYTNCDGNTFNKFFFTMNSNSSYATLGFISKFIPTLIKYNNTISNEYFFETTFAFGGCGEFSKDLSYNIKGFALGIR